MIYPYYSIDYKREPFSQNFKKYLNLKWDDRYSGDINEVIEESTNNYTKNMDLLEYLFENDKLGLYGKVYDDFIKTSDFIEEHGQNYVEIDAYCVYGEDTYIPGSCSLVRLNLSIFSKKSENFYRNLMIATILCYKNIDKNIVILPKEEKIEIIDRLSESDIAFIYSAISEFDKIIINEKEYSDISKINLDEITKDSKISIIKKDITVKFVPKKDAKIPKREYSSNDSAFLSPIAWIGALILYILFLPVGIKNAIKDFKEKQKRKQYDSLPYIKKHEKAYKSYMMIE